MDYESLKLLRHDYVMTHLLRNRYVMAEHASKRALWPLSTYDVIETVTLCNDYVMHKLLNKLYLEQLVIFTRSKAYYII